MTIEPGGLAAPAAAARVPYVLGQRSKQNLEGVHPILRGIVLRAITLSEQDFGVYEGVRTAERQKKLVAAGASRTMNSMHIARHDFLAEDMGLLGHAVDLVPWIDGQWRWEWGACYRIAAAMDAAATEQGVAHYLCWGGVWDRFMSQYGGSAEAVKLEGYAYNKRHPGPDFPDGPHFQIGRLG